MIDYSSVQLANGLKVLVHKEESTPMAVVNVLYNVGARDESPHRTGFAHLFEHLMFGGSPNIHNFDIPIQEAGGENNAFTNNDITNFYDVVPAQNLETALWLEADRMLSLNFDEDILQVQKKVVVEEFKENCLNQPYGDVWHHIADLAYKVHPYRWPTIGKAPLHIEEASLTEVKDFYQRFYNPNNAILTISGNVEIDKTVKLVQKWFEEIPSGPQYIRKLPMEPPQIRPQEHSSKTTVPSDAIYLVFHTCGRLDPDFYATDLLSDILSNGPSSRLYRHLLKDKQLFTQIDCFINGTIDPGLMIIEGKLTPGVTLEMAESSIWKELNALKENKIESYELQKWKNKVESTLLFSELNTLNTAINLSFFELLGQPELINNEMHYYHQVSADNIQQLAQQLFTKENCSTVYYEID